ncbi:MAG: hypothetical protein K0U93_30165 [Gammaproteobacteria bacterium]|nr:hypothetical protein [Gammaproteobacteria bacterium]
MRYIIFAIATALSFGASAGGMTGKDHGCAYSGEHQATNSETPKLSMDKLLADAEAMKAPSDAKQGSTLAATPAEKAAKPSKE